MTLFKFTPDMIDPEILKQITVGRKQLLLDLTKRIKEHATKKIPIYLLFIGPRGIGKSHLLLLLYYRIRDAPELWNVVKPIKLSEEEYSVVKLSDLFFRILEEEEFDGSNSDEELIIERTISYLNKLKEEKMPLLLIDNINLVFGQLTEQDLNRFRSILQEHNNLMIIGTAPAFFGEIMDYEQPFYDFFEIQFLKDLTDNEIEEFIKKKLELEKKEEILAEYEKYGQKIRAITVLTGGNPRLVISLCDILCEPQRLMDVEKALLTLLDELTPFYQARMETLPNQQRKVFDTLTTSEGPLTPTKIAKLSGYEVNVVNVQIKRLQNAGLVEPVKFRRKRSIHYEVKERLFRIWREMRSPLGRKRIGLFVRFLKLWYSKEELVKGYNELIQSFEKIESRDTFKATRLIDHIWYIQEAIGAPAKYELIEQRYLSLITSENFVAAEKELAAIKTISHRDKKAKVMQLSFKALLHHAKGELEKCMKSASKAASLEPKNPLAIYTMAIALRAHERFEEAIEYVNLLITKDDIMWKVFGLFAKADLLRFMENYPEALSTIDKAIRIVNKISDFWTLKGQILHSMKKAEAFSCYNKAIELDPNNKMALLGRAIAAVGFEKDEAEKWVNEYLSIEPDDLYANLLKSIVLLDRDDVVTAESIAGKYLALADVERKHLFASILFTARGLRSIQELKEGYVEKATATFLDMLQLREDSEVEMFRDCLFLYFRNLFKNKNFGFIPEAFSLANKKLDHDDTQIVIPLVKAAEYINTENTDLLEELQKETRQIVASIIKKYSPETTLPKELEKT